MTTDETTQQLTRLAAQGDPQAEASLVRATERATGKRARKPGAPRRVYQVRHFGGGDSVIVRLGRRTLASALAVAREQACEGSGEIESTVWCDYDLLDARGELISTHEVEVDPIQPRCADGFRDSHDWREVEGSIRGNGGGITYREECAHCRAQKHVNTWAHRPDNGQQGKTSIRYERDED